MMHTTPSNDPKTGLFPDSGAFTDLTPASASSPWTDRPFVIKTKKPDPPLSRLKPIPATADPPSSPARSFVKRPPHPLLRSDPGLSPLPIASLASKAMSTPLTEVEDVPPSEQ